MSKESSSSEESSEEEEEVRSTVGKLDDDEITVCRFDSRLKDEDENFTNINESVSSFEEPSIFQITPEVSKWKKVANTKLVVRTTGIKPQCSVGDLQVVSFRETPKIDRSRNFGPRAVSSKPTQRTLEKKKFDHSESKTKASLSFDLENMENEEVMNRLQ